MLSECWFFSGFFLPKGKFVIPWTVWFSLHTWQPENRQRKTAHKKKKIYGHLKNLDTIEAGKISPSRDLNTWKKTAVDVGALWLFPNLFFFYRKPDIWHLYPPLVHWWSHSITEILWAGQAGPALGEAVLDVLNHLPALPVPGTSPDRIQVIALHSFNSFAESKGKSCDFCGKKN